jgi:hypothetical protein
MKPYAGSKNARGNAGDAGCGFGDVPMGALAWAAPCNSGWRLHARLQAIHTSRLDVFHLEVALSLEEKDVLSGL